VAADAAWDRLQITFAVLALAAHAMPQPGAIIGGAGGFKYVGKH